MGRQVTLLMSSLRYVLKVEAIPRVQCQRELKPSEGLGGHQGPQGGLTAAMLAHARARPGAERSVCFPSFHVSKGTGVLGHSRDGKGPRGDVRWLLCIHSGRWHSGVYTSHETPET